MEVIILIVGIIGLIISAICLGVALLLFGKLSKLSQNDASDKKLAEVIIQNTEDKNQEILILDSLQTVSKEDMESGYTYLKAMESNLLVMEQALGVEK